jgi:hypothetical protein
MIIKPKPTVLDETIDACLAQLSGIPVESDEFNRKMEQINKLYALREKHAKKGVSSDTLLIVAGNLAGIVMILGYERAHVVTSKALGFVLKTPVKP